MTRTDGRNSTQETRPSVRPSNPMPKRALHKVTPPFSRPRFVLLLWPLPPSTPGRRIHPPPHCIVMSSRLHCCRRNSSGTCARWVDDGDGLEWKGGRACDDGGREGIKGIGRRVCNKGGIETTPALPSRYTVDEEIVPSHSSLLWIILFATGRGARRAPFSFSTASGL